MDINSNQVASVLKRAVQMLLTRGLSDPRVQGMISVTTVELSADRSEAVIGVSILPEKKVELTMHGLKNAAGHIRYQLSREVKIRRIPRIIFKLDKSLKKQSEVLAAIANARIMNSVAETETAPDPLSNNSRSEVPES